MALTREDKERRQKLRNIIANYLETQTRWGKYMARPAQIRAAAKKLQMGRNIPYPIAKALGKVA